MVNRTALLPGGMPRPAGLAGVRDALLLSIMAWMTRRVVDGRISLTLPSGRTATLGSGVEGADAHLALTSFAVFWAALRRGTLGFAESYIEGDIESQDLGEVFRFFIDNKANLDRAGRGLFSVRRPDLAYRDGNRNTRDGSRRNIAAHYDLGNAFYELWLDPGMTYSSACFSAAEQTLEEAQAEKNRRILDALEVTSGMRLLEIGCGWGGFALAAAQKGLQVTAITLSVEQLKYATRRVEAAGCASSVDVRFEDYRDVRGAFDRIASIEMIEAVGEENWSTYFKVLHDLLAPGGVAVIQAITIRESSWSAYRAKTDFIQRYIFPGGMLPTKSHVREHAANAGLDLEVIGTFAADYSRTLAAWRDRVRESWPRLRALGFDERFLRMWDYYLTYCEIGFDRGVCDVGHYRLRKPATAAR